jgi:hypothetical protein
VPRVDSRGVGVILEGDIAYFRRRASEERTAALQALHPSVRKAHTTMAERYEDLVRGMASYERALGFRLVN